jgi:hypothetical protein
MGEFHQHPDGFIYVRADNGTHYADTKDNFVLDSGIALPLLPDGADDHIYTQGRRHAFMGNGDIIDGGPVPWPWGDDVIANIAVLIAAQKARTPVKEPLSPSLVPQTISDRQFYQQLAISGIITETDALAANAAVIPPPLMAIVDALPADLQFNAKMLLSGAVTFERNHPMTIGIGSAYGWTSEQIDAFFVAASAL